MNKPSMVNPQLQEDKKVSEKIGTIFGIVIMTCVSAITITGTVKTIIWMLR